MDIDRPEIVQVSLYLIYSLVYTYNIKLKNYNIQTSAINSNPPSFWNL